MSSQSKEKSSGKVYGYARATTQKQKTKSQAEKIRKAYPEAKIYADEYSGIRAEHPSWEKLRAKLKPGDQIILCDITKLADDPELCASIYADLFRQGIKLTMLDDPLLCSEIFSGALTDPSESSSEIVLRAAVSQIILSHSLRLAKEKKTGAHIRDALMQSQAKGKHIGRPQKAYADSKKAIEAKQKIWKLSADFQGSIPDPELMELVGVARNTFYKYKKHLSLYGPEASDKTGGKKK